MLDVHEKIKRAEWGRVGFSMCWITLRRCCLNDRELAMGIFGGRVFQANESASAHLVVGLVYSRKSIEGTRAGHVPSPSTSLFILRSVAFITN